MISFVLGGARSGKSAYAEQLAKNSAKEVIYIATAQAKDDEMQQRILHHRQQRPNEWKTVEEPYALAQTLITQADSKRCLLVDCLTLWLTNILFDAQGEFQQDFFQQQKQALMACLAHLDADVIFVSNEVGQGIIPMNKMARRFVDEAGWLHQDLAARSDKVILMNAGLAQVLK